MGLEEMGIFIRDAPSGSNFSLEGEKECVSSLALVGNYIINVNNVFSY